jgi:hypothetical protein
MEVRRDAGQRGAIGPNGSLLAAIRDPSAERSRIGISGPGAPESSSPSGTSDGGQIAESLRERIDPCVRSVRTAFRGGGPRSERQQAVECIKHEPRCRCVVRAALCGAEELVPMLLAPILGPPPARVVQALEDDGPNDGVVDPRMARRASPRRRPGAEGLALRTDSVAHGELAVEQRPEMAADSARCRRDGRDRYCHYEPPCARLSPGAAPGSGPERASSRAAIVIPT